MTEWAGWQVTDQAEMRRLTEDDLREMTAKAEWTTVVEGKVRLAMSPGLAVKEIIAQENQQFPDSLVTRVSVWGCALGDYQVLGVERFHDHKMGARSWWLDTGVDLVRLGVEFVVVELAEVLPEYAERIQAAKDRVAAREVCDEP